MSACVSDVLFFRTVQVRTNWSKDGFNGYRGDYLAIPTALAAVFHPRNVYYVLLDPGISEAEAATLRRLVVRAVLQSPPRHCPDAACVESCLHVRGGDFSVTWAGISEPLATLDTMAQLLAADDRWDVFINLTPLDYPLASQNDIAVLLAHVRGFSFAGSYEAGPRQAEGMYEKWWHQLNHDPALFHKRSPADTMDTERQKLVRLQGGLPWEIKDSPSLRIFHAEAYGIWDRAFCQYAVNSPLSRRAIALLSHGFGASEELLPSVLMNSPEQHAHCPSSWRMNTHGMGPHWKMDKTNEEDTVHRIVSDMAGTGLLFARKFPTPCVASDDNCQSAYDKEPYRAAVRMRLLRDETTTRAGAATSDPPLRQAWRAAAAQKLSRLIPSCRDNTPALSPSLRGLNGTSCTAGPCVPSWSVNWLP